MAKQLPKGISRKGEKFLARKHHQGLRLSKVFNTLREANAWLAEQDLEVEQGTFRTLAPTRAGTKSQITFAEFAVSSFARRNLTEKTLYDYNRWMRAHLLPFFGDMRMRQITIATVNAWFDGMDKKYLTTRARVYEILTTIFKHAVEDGIIDVNPCVIRKGSSSQSTFRPEIPEIEQLNLLLDSLHSPKYRMMCELSAWCGLRQGEAFALRRENIRYKDGRPTHLLVRWSVIWVSDKPIIKPPKTRAGIRDVPVPPHVQANLDAYLESLPAAPETLLFPSAHDSSKPMRCGTLYTVYFPARKAAGLPKLRWHDLRHFAATQAAIAGATTRELMTLLGHSTPNAAMRYQQVASGRLEDISVRMSENATKVVRFPMERVSGV